MEGDQKKLMISPLPCPESSREFPTIDLNHLISYHNSEARSLVIARLRQACQQVGFFRITNHGISKSVIEDALSSSENFFDLPNEEKKKMSSEDVTKPVRYGVIQSNDIDGNNRSREIIKHYAHPIEDWIDSWPHKPVNYRYKMGKYATEVRQLGINIIVVIMESLGLSPNYLRKSIEKGMQIIVINSYPQCSSSTTNIEGISSHTDHSIITILVESTPGLEILDSRDNSWKLVPVTEKGAIVLVGNHLEAISNGLYRSVVHKVVQSSQSRRVSIGSFHSLPMEEKVEPALELVNKENPKRFRASSLSDYIKYLSSKETKTYIESLKI